uniref:RPE65 homolog n=2 Tax=Ciona intestinalis TaxID=7719 RepID=Q2PE71_CIOIN|nr:RPE65 homolog [Ciona intestinalis]BAE73258.1 RPE65 homolog [Ciona intestinalis]|eukprot:NP_001071891.1 RPE65 homolog [Ciona intestinalis]
MFAIQRRPFFAVFRNFNKMSAPSKTKSYVKLLQKAEERANAECVVTGCIPEWLNGDVLRNGPAEFDIGPDTFKHWFDGHALLHKFSMFEGKVTYSSKFLRSGTYKTNHENSRIIIGEFGTASRPDPCKNMFSRFFTNFVEIAPRSDNANVSVAQLGEAYYAITDGPTAYGFDPETLETKNLITDCGPANMTVTAAHPHYDRNGDYLNLGTTFGRTPHYHVIKVPAAKMTSPDPMNELEVFMKFPSTTSNASYHHSFGLSENWIIFHEQPFSFSTPKLLIGLKLWNPILSSFYEDKQTISFHIINKTTGEKIATKYEARGMFCFHHINAYETKENDGKRFIVVDMCGSDRSLVWLLGLDTLLDEEAHDKVVSNLDEKYLTRPRRIVIPLDISSDTPNDTNLVTIPGCKATAMLNKSGVVSLTYELLVPDDFPNTELGIELPRINYDGYNGREYKFIYAISSEYILPSHLVKINVETKEIKYWKEKDKYTSEPIFVPRPGSQDEDDGVVLSTVISPTDDKTFLLILDGQSFKEIARAEIETKMSYPLHGLFSKRD